MRKSKIIFISGALAAALLFALFASLAGPWGDAATVNALPAPDPGRHLALPGDAPVFSDPEAGVAEIAPEAAAGLDFRFIKSVTIWHDGTGTDDCNAINWNNRVLVVNYGDFVRYCYDGTNIGTTTILTHTIFDEGLNAYAMNNQQFEMPPDGFLKFYTHKITITKETVGNAWWQVTDENLNTLTKYQSTLVKVALRFHGYTFDALPGDPSPKPKLGGVLLELYGWDEGDVITESLRMTTTSDASGFWNFFMPDTYDYYQIVANAPQNYVNIDAWAPRGEKVNNGALKWDHPDRSIVQESQFYFAIPTPTPTPTITPTPTTTPTPTITPTTPPDMQPDIWLPVVLQ